MITFLFRTLMFIASAGLGIIAADLLLPGFRIEWDQWWGFVICVLIFALLQTILSPWIAKMARRYAPVLLGGIGIISTPSPCSSSFRCRSEGSASRMPSGGSSGR